MLGLAIKGAVWIGFAGAFLGLGFSGLRVRPGELALLLLDMLVYRDPVIEPVTGWLLYLALPLALTGFVAAWFAGRSCLRRPAHDLLLSTLLLATWLFFGLNFAVFRYPWPWAEWTVRTPNAMVLAACAVGLTWLVIGRAFVLGPKRRAES